MRSKGVKNFKIKVQFNGTLITSFHGVFISKHWYNSRTHGHDLSVQSGEAIGLELLKIVKLSCLKLSILMRSIIKFNL